MATLPPNFRELAVERMEEARRFWRNWRGEARDDYAFISGDQWLTEDRAILESQKRPPITFNYSEKMIDAVVGAEVSSRQETTYSPRTVDDAPIAETFTNALRWVRDEEDIEDEESDAFRDALICGLGWTHTKVNFEIDPDGMIETHRIDPLEMYADPSATKPGLAERRYAFRNMWIDERQAKRQWPGNAFLGMDTEGENAGMTVTRHGQHYNNPEPNDPDNHDGQVCIRHYECYELMPYRRIVTPQGMISLSEEDYAKMKDELDKQDVKVVKMFRRKYYYAYFSGETMLEADESPTQEGFTYQCITGKRDRNKNTWYGLTRVMKDPQRWANKWLSQILHIINSNAKGGLLAEVTAFVDSSRAQEEWSSPESIIWLKEGGIGKIKEKTMTSYPSGLDRLMEFALASLPQVTGINLEALGLAARDQANVLEQSRKQAAYGLLAPVFDALRRYRKFQGRIMLDLIDKYIFDGRMIRIGGPESQQFVRLIHQPGVKHYDIIVDQSPTAPDIKRETWSVLQSLLPAAMKAGIPIPPTILKYAPLPSTLALEWQQYAQQSRTSPEQMQQLQQQLQQLSDQNKQLQQQLKDKSEELKLEAASMQAEFQLKQQNQQFEHRLRMAELEEKLTLMKSEAEAEIQFKLISKQADHMAKMHDINTSIALENKRIESEASSKQE